MRHAAEPLRTRTIPYVFDVVNEVGCRHDNGGDFHSHPAVVSECEFKLKVNCDKTEEY